jgi:hypothetical protein
MHPADETTTRTLLENTPETRRYAAILPDHFIKKIMYIN